MVDSDFYLNIQALLFQAINKKSRQRLHTYKDEMNNALDKMIDGKEIPYPNDFEKIVYRFVVASHFERAKRSRNIQITQLVIGWKKKFPKSSMDDFLNYISTHIESDEELKLAENIFEVVSKKIAEQN